MGRRSLGVGKAAAPALIVAPHWSNRRGTKTTNATDYRWVYEELTKLDRFLGLPDGTTRAVTACDPTNVPLLNEKMKQYGMVFADDATVDRAYRGKWKVLLQRVGVSRAGWMDGDPSVAELPKEIEKI